MKKIILIIGLALCVASVQAQSQNYRALAQQAAASSTVNIDRSNTNAPVYSITVPGQLDAELIALKEPNETEELYVRRALAAGVVALAAERDRLRRNERILNAQKVEAGLQ